MTQFYIWALHVQIPHLLGNEEWNSTLPKHAAHRCAPDGGIQIPALQQQQTTSIRWNEPPIVTAKVNNLLRISINPIITIEKPEQNQR